MRVTFIWEGSDPEHGDVVNYKKEQYTRKRVEMSTTPRIGETINLTDWDEREVEAVTWFLDLDDAYPETDHPYVLVDLGPNLMEKEERGDGSQA